jgi:catechol 2,3-dioxygenase-like lactoylglutathione lyase family enzyme
MHYGVLFRIMVSPFVFALAGCMAEGAEGGSAMTSAQKPGLFSTDTKGAVVRYQVADVDRAVAFYTEHLGFRVAQRPAPILAIIARGDLHLILSGPGSSGSRPMPDGRQQEPGGWNRIVLYVDNLDSTIASLRAAGTRFRNEVEVGPGGKQVQVDDPDGNPIELHEAPGK